VTCTYFGARSVEEFFFFLRLGQTGLSVRHRTMSRGVRFCGGGLQPGAQLGAWEERSKVEGATKLIF
jgi:hypothetical protein